MTIFNDRVVFSSVDDEVLLEFNMPGNGSVRWGCDEMAGWDNTAEPNVAFATYGVFDGAIAVNNFPLKEKYITLEGFCASASREIMERQRDTLVSAFPKGRQFFIERYESTPKRMRVRLSSAIEFPQQFENEFRWLATVVAEYPIKESFTEHTAYVNTFAGGTIYREYIGQVDGDTNFSNNPSFELNTTTGVTAAGTSTITRVNTPTPASGTWAARISTSATANSGIAIRSPIVTPNSYDPVRWNGTISLRGNAGGEVVATWVRINYVDGSTSEGTHTSRTLTTTYTTYVDFAIPDESKDISYIEVHARCPGTTAGVVFFADRVHINAGDASTAAFTETTANAFHTGTAFITPVSRQANPKTPGKRIYSEYTRAYTVGIGEGGPGTIESATVNNAGNNVAYPITVITGPLYDGAWEIRNETTNQRLAFRVDIPQGSSLTIDHLNHTASLNGQSVEFRKDGTWWGLEPGVNQLRLASDEFNDSATATFSYHDAWRN